MMSSGSSGSSRYRRSSAQPERKKVYIVNESPRNIIQDGAGELFKFYGCTVELADPINGWYVQQPYLINDRPFFIRQTNGPDSDPMCIWYLIKFKAWAVCNRTQMGRDEIKAISSQTTVMHPAEYEEGWRVFLPTIKNFKLVQNQTFRAASEPEVLETIQGRIKVAGRAGYNRAMNGVYNRGEELHHGKSYYKHEKNDFTIRWYQTKWVVDWRAGLHNDNVGAAVCKEDVPEPWMCCIPWRIYDGKAEGKKWNYDKNVKIKPESVFDDNCAQPFE